MKSTQIDPLKRQDHKTFSNCIKFVLKIAYRLLPASLF